MATLYNPGEPVFDQATGDIVVDPSTGDAVTVEPETLDTDPVTGQVHQRDDVANALWYRVNTWTGEVLRDRSLGVDFHNVVFASPFQEDAVVTEIRATAKATPGVAALTEGRLVRYDAASRTAGFVFRLRKRDGSALPGFSQVG